MSFNNKEAPPLIRVQENAEAVALPSVTDSSPTVVRRQATTPSRTPLRKETLHSVEVWDSKRDVIRELYMDQNKPLREVSSILERQHNFIASPKQYKIRFKQWGFWKNLSTQHASSLLELKKSRESLGKPSTFVRSGQKLEQNRIERTIRRSKTRASAKDGSKQDTSKMPVTVMNEPCVPGQSLPAGIECRTPSPDPQLNHNDGSLFDSCDMLEPELDVCQLSEVYNFEAAAAGQQDQQDEQDTYPDRLKIYDIAIRKLGTARFSWGPPAPSDEPPAGIQAFRHRNALLAVLEPAIVDKKQLCTTYLQNYAATFLDCPKLSQFNLQYVLPALPHDGRSGEIAALSREAENFIQMGIKMLHLSAHTMNLIERAASSTQSNKQEEDDPMALYEDAINPAILNGTLVSNVPNVNLDTFDFDIPEEALVMSNASSPSTTTFSASDHAMSPFTLVDGSSPATETDYTALNWGLTAAQYQVDNLDSHLLHGLDLSILLHQSGDSETAMTGLQSVAASKNLSTARGKVLTRLAWFCLACIYREQGITDKAGSCLAEAVRGSMNYRDDMGEDWHEVSHLFV
ncbi:hypothetical protein N0V93_001605 [Gnomoniopsis smithogilvyi]|uniref:Clr5 domain-containing protein n=1 Tax=Gnomoniopsis smithogilvyi TaxID=1191159 RepID=A0A9W8Z407_9PEZI|nr:hypothetical protein N0V93_001605 [Gnomoniopsis smithogilvyi]